MQTGRHDQRSAEFSRFAGELSCGGRRFCKPGWSCDRRSYVELQALQKRPSRTTICPSSDGQIRTRPAHLYSPVIRAIRGQVSQNLMQYAR